MDHELRGIPSLDLDPGEYTIVPSEWRRDVNAQIDNLTSGSGKGDEPMWHLYNVETAHGRRILEVVDDRRGMEGTFDVSGQQFLLRSPDEEPLMAFTRDSAKIGSSTTLRAIDSGEVLGSWEMTSTLRQHWEFRDANQNPRISVQRQWSLSGLVSPTYQLTSAAGDAIGEFDMRQDGLFYEADVTLGQSPISPEISLALVCGIFWAMNQS